MNANDLMINCERIAKKYNEEILQENWKKVWDYELFYDFHFRPYADLKINKIDYDVYSEEQMIIKIISYVTSQLTNTEEIKNGYEEDSIIGKMINYY